MLSSRVSLRLGTTCLLFVLAGVPVQAQDAGTPQAQPVPPVSNYDKEIFQKTIPQDQLAFLSQFDGAASKDLFRDKQFRKLMKSFVPDCMFHYGRDIPLPDALAMVIEASRIPVRIREGRYLVLWGNGGPYLSGRGFLWVDLQDGIGLGAFYFHPTNGEPTPSVNIFSRQVKEETLGLSQLPPAFAEDLGAWTWEARIEPITTRYFLTGSNKKILLEHDEDFCLAADGRVAPPGDACEQRNADAADLDMDAASYVEQTHHATNATAWMITGADQVAWLQVRASRCGLGPDPLGCRIRMTRERTRVILRQPPVPRPLR